MARPSRPPPGGGDQSAHSQADRHAGCPSRQGIEHDHAQDAAEHGDGMGELEADILAALGLKSIPRRKRSVRETEPQDEDAETAPARPVREALPTEPFLL